MANSAPEESQLNVQGYNIVTILKRLEAATSRLEDITIFQEENTSSNSPPTAETPAAAIAGGSALASSVLETPPAPTPAPAPAEKAKFVKEFEQFITNYIDPFVESSKEIDSTVGEAAGALRDAFGEQIKFLELVSTTKKPAVSDPKFVELLTPINVKIEKISGIKDANRRSNFFNHLNTISEGAPVLGWIVSDTPVSYVPEFKDTAQFWSNRVMKEFKDKDPKQVEWVKQFLAIFDHLRAYVKEYHATGPSWNANGKPLAESVAAQKGSSSSAPPAPSAPATGAGASAPPPPPPPAPPASFFEEPAEKSGGMGAVFADLNKGQNITSGLKKVEKSQMTHKNPGLRAQGQVSGKPAPPKKPHTLSLGSNIPKRKPARKELVDGSKWMIENFTLADVSEPIVVNLEMLQSVFIGHTSGVTVQITGKGNAVSISETAKTAVVVESLISGIDVIKSHKFGIQVTGVVPLITVDKSDEGSIYLSQETIDADSHVMTSNSTALNINVLKDEDYVELPIPEQLLHSIKDGKLVSTIVEHKG